MIIQYYATLISPEDCEHITAFIINKPRAVEKGAYKQTTSLDAFNNRQHDLLDAEKLWFSVVSMREMLPSCLSLDKALGIIPLECSSVWDFYEKIGWDFKSKQFVNGIIESFSAPCVGIEREEKGQKWAEELLANLN